MKVIKKLNFVDAPYQDIPNECLWSLNQTQVCRVAFLATTEVQMLKVTKDGKFP